MVLKKALTFNFTLTLSYFEDFSEIINIKPSQNNPLVTFGIFFC